MRVAYWTLLYLQKHTRTNFMDQQRQIKFLDFWINLLGFEISFYLHLHPDNSGPVLDENSIFLDQFTWI